MPKFVSKTYTKDSPADYNYANDLETRIGNAIDPIVDLGISRIVRDSSGWRVVEYADGYTIFEKTAFSPGVTFNAIAIGYARTISNSQFEGGLSFPYPLKSIVGVEAVPNVLNISGFNNNVNVDNIIASLNGVDAIRLFTAEQNTRNIRLFIRVSGYR